MAGLHFRKLHQLFESLAPPEERAGQFRRVGENYQERLLSIDLPIIAAQVIENREEVFEEKGEA